MLTVPEAARRTGRNPETIRRWIRAGRLKSEKVGTQHIIEEADLNALFDDEDDLRDLPPDWRTPPGAKEINWARAVREIRS